jgi:hypothetical protein
MKKKKKSKAKSSSFGELYFDEIKSRDTSRKQKEFEKMLFRDRGKGLENIRMESLNPIAPDVDTYKALSNWLEKLKITSRTAYTILEKFLFTDKNSRQNFFQHVVLKDLEDNKVEARRLLAAIKKHGNKKVFERTDSDEALSAFETMTLYRSPPKIKTFTADITKIRASLGTKRKRDGSYARNQLAVAKARAARKSYKGKREF